MQLWELGALQAVAAMRAGDFSPVDFVRELLHRIDATESRVEAWATLDPDGALLAASELERHRKRRAADPLFGLPVGLKDIFDARGLPTGANFEPYRSRIAARDAAATGQLRDAGAVILGKTVTVQFAAGTAAPKTKNPWNGSASPGGSSSGSAAAVSARQVPVALGTQTGGSLLRPASFCGVVGLKPTLGRLSRFGVLPVSWTFDQPGVIARSVADVALTLSPLSQHDRRDPYSTEQPTEDFVAFTQKHTRPPRLGFMMEILERADPEVRSSAEATLRELERAGAELREVRLTVGVDTLLAVYSLMRGGEVAEVHSNRVLELSTHYEPSIRANIEASHLIPAWIAVRASRLRGRYRREVDSAFEGIDAIVGPTVASMPPPRAQGTGDASLQTIWSLFGLPAISIPTTLGPGRMPHGLQLVSPAYAEGQLLRTAAWCEAILGSLPSPLDAPELRESQG